MRARTSERWVELGLSVFLMSSCADAATRDGASQPTPCVPGEQRVCPCAGAAPAGVQVCTAAGDQFGVCMGCEGGTGSTSAVGETTADSGPNTSADTSASSTASTGGADSSGSAAESGLADDGIPDGPPQAVPPAPPPDGSDVVNEVAAEHEDWLIASCVDQGGNNEFLFEVVRRLRQQDDRWGLNWKRGVIGDMSQDVVDYHWGDGVSEESTDVYIIDVIGGHCPRDAATPQPAWIDVTQATLDAGTIGMWTLADQEL